MSKRDVCECTQSSWKAVCTVENDVARNILFDVQLIIVMSPGKTWQTALFANRYTKKRECKHGERNNSDLLSRLSSTILDLFGSNKQNPPLNR